MYKNILIPVAVDPECNAARALDVARRLLSAGGHITLVSVVEDVPAYVVEYVAVKPARMIKEKVRKKLAECVKNESDVEIDVIEGHAAVSITKFAESHDIDLIIVDSHRPGVEDFFLGSTASRVVRRAPCAVHVLR